MNQPRRQAYLTLIESLLTCPSDEQTAILQANLELLDDDFAQYLREWATQTRVNIEEERVYNRANILDNFAQFLRKTATKAMGIVEKNRAYNRANIFYNLNLK